MMVEDRHLITFLHIYPICLVTYPILLVEFIPIFCMCIYIYMLHFVGCISHYICITPLYFTCWNRHRQYENCVLIKFVHVSYESCHKPTNQATNRPTDQPTNLGRCSSLTVYWYYGKSQFLVALLKYQRVFDRFFEQCHKQIGLLSILRFYQDSTKLFSTGIGQQSLVYGHPSHNRNPKIIAIQIPFFSGFYSSSPSIPVIGTYSTSILGS